jgi:cytosine permease
MRLLAVILGVIGVAVAVAGVWTLFAAWLNILGIFVPPIGAVLITDQILLRRRAEGRSPVPVRPTAFLAWLAGAGAAAIVHYTAPQYAEAVVGMLAAAVAYLLIQLVQPSFELKPEVSL